MALYFQTILLLSLLLFSCSSKPVQNSGTEDVVYGHIRDAKTFESIQGVEVITLNIDLRDKESVDTTDSNGNYRLDNLQLGYIQMTVTGVGYKQVIAEIKYEGGEYLRNFDLTPDSTVRSLKKSADVSGIVRKNVF